ncbi:MAG: preprotein translocase subunit YajC [Lentisphaeria bacterium]|nr:preprotein translocase subunit YajC [Lentisphaeria bacterium]
MNSALLKFLSFAQEATEAAAPATQGANAARPSAGGFGSLWIFIPIFGLMYFLMIRPQQKKQKQMQEMLSKVKAGDKVMLNSGALGTIVSVAEKTVRVSFCDGHQIDFVRAAIAEILTEFPSDKVEKK